MIRDARNVQEQIQHPVPGKGLYFSANRAQQDLAGGCRSGDLGQGRQQNCRTGELPAQGKNSIVSMSLQCPQPVGNGILGALHPLCPCCASHEQPCTCPPFSSTHPYSSLPVPCCNGLKLSALSALFQGCLRS